MKMGVMRRRPSLVLVSICLLCCSQTNVIPLHHCSRLQWTAMHILNITLSLDHQSYLLLRWSSSLGRKGRSFHRLDASRVTQPTVSKQSHATTNAYNTIRTLSLNSYTPANYEVFKKSSPSSCICYHLSDSKLILIWQKRRQSPSERKNTYLLNVIMY